MALTWLGIFMRKSLLDPSSMGAAGGGGVLLHAQSLGGCAKGGTPCAHVSFGKLNALCWWHALEWAG